MHRLLNEEDGIILPIVVIFSLVSMITGLTFIHLGTLENRLVRKEIGKKQAFYLAEGGVEDARVQLGQNWDDCASIDTTLGEGTYDVSISESGSNRIVTSTGTVDGTAKKVRVILKPPITSAIEAGGSVMVKGSAEVNGDIEENSDSFEHPDEYFKTVFGVSKADMEQKTINDSPPNIHYDSAINNDIVDNITWVDGGGEWSQIQAGWTGNGIFIVNGDLKITGDCTFDGIIWITGTLTVAAGNAEINGAIFVESDTTVDLSGNLTLTYDLDAITNVLGKLGSTAFGDLGSKGVIVEFWEEF